MAAPMYHTAFCQISNESEIFSVNKCYDEDLIVIANKNKSIDIHMIDDQKVVHSWSLRHGLQLTSPVLWDSESEMFVTIVNHQDVRLWKKDATDFDKTKKKHAKVKLHQVLAVPGFEAVVVCQNGTVEFVSNVKDLTDNGPLSSGEDILWCQAGVHENSIYVICVAQNTQKKGNIKVLTSRHQRDGDAWQCSSTSISPPQPSTDLCACDLVHVQTASKLYLLWSGGELTSLAVDQVVSSTQTREHTLSGVHSSTSIVVIDHTHIAVAGVTQDGTDGIGVYDLKFGILMSWQPFPEPITSSKPKMFYVHNKLFVPCGRTLYSFHVAHQPSTITSLLGRGPSCDLTAAMPLPQHFTWSTTRKSDRSPQKGSDLTSLFTEALSTNLSYAKFEVTFKNLSNALEEAEHRHWLTSDHMTRLLQRCVGETNFWPRDEIQWFIDRKCLPTTLMLGLLEALVDHAELAMVNTLLCTVQDIPEKCLCQALGFFLQIDDEKVASVLGESMDVQEEDKPCPLSPHKSRLVNNILTMPYSDVFLLECLRDVSFKHSLKLLEYLCHLLESSLPVRDSRQHTTRHSQPGHIQVVDWLCLVLDSHMTQFVLSPDAHVTLIKLHDVVAGQAEMYDGLGSLEILLEQLKAKSSIPQDKNIGQYCIEVLHVY